MLRHVDHTKDRPMLSISQISTDEDYDAIRMLLGEFLDWVCTVEPDARDHPPVRTMLQELENLPGIYGPPDGRFLLVRVDGAPAGCAAIFSHGGGTVELKRMYVRPEFRGQKIGSKLVTALFEDARKLKNHRMILNSHHLLKASHHIYRSAGFKEIDAPDDFPAELQDIAIFMEADLNAAV